MNSARWKAAAISGWCVAGALAVVVGGATVDLWAVPVMVERGDPISPELRSKWVKVEQLMREVMKVEDREGMQQTRLKRVMDLQSSHLRDALEKGRMPKAEQEIMSVALDVALDEGQRVLKEREQREALGQRIRNARPIPRKTASERAAEVKARFKKLFSKDQATRDKARQEALDASAPDVGAPPFVSPPIDSKSE